MLVFENRSASVHLGTCAAEAQKNQHLQPAIVEIATGSNTKMNRIISNFCDKKTGILYDQEVILTRENVRKDYPERLRRIKYHDQKTGKILIFITNNFEFPAQTIAELYKARWQVELFFKWIKQHLRIKSFYGTSENAVKTQIWIAICVYVIVAIVKKRLDIPQSLYQMLQVISVNCFEKTEIFSLFNNKNCIYDKNEEAKQLNLFD